MQADIQLLKSSVRYPENIHGYVVARELAGLFILGCDCVLSDP
jgi:hypothetical protein